MDTLLRTSSQMSQNNGFSQVIEVQKPMKQTLKMISVLCAMLSLP